ncbi:hypothetical protein NW762_002711 [Fusarium torreyae]|uniref:Uncharacterized protein n=1 Tax=Fusarium torreyae TaxID=1237075 RepID=A0A9W8SB46_9HYPO|nr:hypothetical protein NW762_002711 [Fusarium torreyae]
MENPGDDPYFWEVDDVVTHLTARGCPWSRDNEALAGRIRDEEFDGKTLLTFEHICSRQELMECLGIKVARHKAAFLEAVVTFRARSKGYWQWQQEFQRKQSSYYALEEFETPPPGAVAPTPLSILTNGDHQKEDRAFASVSATNGTLLDAPAQVSSHPLTDALEISAQQASSNEGQAPPPQEGLQPQTAAHPHRSSSHEAPDRTPDDEERSNKRRRVVPVLLTEKPRNIAAAFVPTEADMLDYTENPDLESEDDAARGFPWENAPLCAYLGPGKISKGAITSPTGMLSSLIVEDGNSFAAVSSHRLPPARRLVANRFTKRLFLDHYRTPKYSSRSSSPVSNQSDEILNLSDLGDEFDEDTLREMKDEEDEKLETLSKDVYPFVTPERIKEILNEAIAAMEQTWRENKLPKYERKAYSLWQKARRHGTRRLQIYHAHQTATHLKSRIANICREIQEQQWTMETHYRDAAKSLEQSIDDKLYQTWFIKMLESSQPPPKPQGVPRPKPAALRQPTGLPDEELLTSSDEDDFIIPDDHVDVVEDGVSADRELLSHLMKEESPGSDTAFVDLTQDDMDEPMGGGYDLTHPIDLTSPAKSVNSPMPKGSQQDDGVPVDGVPLSNVPESHVLESQAPESQAPESHVVENTHEDNAPSSQPPVNQAFQTRDPENQVPEIASESAPLPKKLKTPTPPPIETLGNLEEIGSRSLNNLAKRNDRWRLLIGEMWQMEHARRKLVVDLMLSDHPDAVWDTHIEPYIMEPLRDVQQLAPRNPKVVLFDAVRLFYCFFSCNHTRDDQMLVFRPGKFRKRIIPARVKFFKPMCMFIEALAPYFPQDSQIYRQDIDILDELFPDEAEDGLDDLEQEEEDVTRRQKPKGKEIIRDKAAVDLRERENQRLQEQEARRKKLRATLASHGLMSGDRTRLIINESKEEDQSLIYINEEIGHSIKNHQVDGVRFIWNQIVRDPALRQGCLLAHTMGLGKTMQAITFLVALAEAAESEDPSVVAQIPEDLRESRTLVLCPATMVENWSDEFLYWAPKSLLGEMRTVTSDMLPIERSSTVSAWASGKGVLLVGYHMFQKVLDMSEDMANLLTNTPDIVIADEAHVMKNRNSKTNQACSRFRTRGRLALTGSPLSNSVLEYYSMIDWVAPNFLGPYSEFREIYARPVELGLYHDSSRSEKRKAIMKLQALKTVVAPKVHRRTIASLKDELPPKQEFILSVSPTESQKKLYELYLRGIAREGGDAKARTLAATSHLGLICNHPHCFQAKVKKIQNGDSQNEDDDEKETDTSFPRAAIPEFLRALQSLRDPLTPSLSWKTEMLTVILDEARKVGDKVLVFSQSLITLDYIQEMCRMQARRVSRLDGKTPIGARQQDTKEFNAGDKEVYLISTTAGGIGLNIQGANRVVIFDTKWNPMHEQQAVGRSYRLNQQKPVVVYRFIVAGTFEDNINNKQVFKMQLASRVVDKKNPVAWSKREGDVVAEIRPRPATDLDPFMGRDRILNKLIGLRKNGEAVRSIVTTDTFEEEDADAKLTAEEDKEVNEMIKLNHLRFNNPEEYARTRDRPDFMEQSRLLREQYQTFDPPPSSHQPVHQSFDGTSDVPSYGQAASPATMQYYGWAQPGASRPPYDASATTNWTASQQSAIHPQGPVPMPMAGANTFFGEHRHSEPSIIQHSQPTPSLVQQQRPMLPLQEPTRPTPPQTPIVRPTNITTPTSTPKQEPKPAQDSATPPRPNSLFKQGGLFNVSESPKKVEFEKKLRESIHTLQQRDVPRTGGDPADIARSLTTRLDQLRKEGKFGFLPDTQRWKFLNGLLSHEKFVIAIIAGYLSPEFVALANEKALEERVQIINGLEETDIPARAHQRANSPDPNV